MGMLCASRLSFYLLAYESQEKKRKKENPTVRFNLFTQLCGRASLCSEVTEKCDVYSFKHAQVFSSGSDRRKASR